MLYELCPELAGSRARRAPGRSIPGPARGGAAGRRAGPGDAPVGPPCWRWPSALARTSSPAARPAGVRRSHQHPVHQSAPPASPKAPRSPTTTSSTTATSSAKRCASPTRTASASPCRSTTASAWCWATWPQSRTARLWSSPATAFEAAGSPAKPCRRSNAPRSTASRPCSPPRWSIPTSRKRRSPDASHRHHGRLPLPDRGDEAGHHRCTAPGDHHRLRHDRDLPVSPQTTADDPIELRVSTVGRMHPHVEAKIIDRRRASRCPIGEPGELCTRGYLVMLGYWNNHEATAEAIDAAGWMHTGDLAVMDENGYVNIVGRIKDMIIRGGENIYPREVEEFLYTHPKRQRRPGHRRARQEVRRGGNGLDQAQGRRADSPTPRRSASSARTRSPTSRSRTTSSS